MSLKIEFVERAEGGEKIAALCREFGISRTAGHKWVKRFKERGHAGLEDESRRPKSAPLATAEELVIATIEAREAHPRWGPRKLYTLLRRRFSDKTPSVRTIARILKRANKVRERRKRAPISVIEQAPKLVAEAPNDVWTVDFKGWWRVLDGSRCEPLTVRDACSRFVLALVASSTTAASVRSIFEQLFRRHGVPKAIQCDNGTPFISVRSRAGLSALSAWWISLGIRVVRSRPGCPQDNGGHERMHADICAEVQTDPAETLIEQQRLLDRWRQEFNHVRPHEALGGKTPAEVYKVIERRKPVPLQYDYPKRFFVHTVDTDGQVQFRGDACRIGSAFSRLEVGLEVVDAMHVRAWLHDVDLGLIETMPAVDPACFEPQLARRAKRACKNAVPNSDRGSAPPATSVSPL
jgi:transposase InsO family protein